LSAVAKSARGQAITFAWPTSLVVWKKRSGSRLRDLPEALDVRFATPFSRRLAKRRAVDVAPGGVAVAVAPEDRLMVGMVLPQLTLTLPKGRVEARGIVRHLRTEEDTLVAGIELSAIEGEALLEDFIDSHVYPQIRRAEGGDLTQLWALYESTLLGGRRVPGAEWLLGSIAATRSTVLGRGRDVACVVAGGPPGSIEGTVELLRTWRGTWSLQHVAMLAKSRLTIDQLALYALVAVARRRDFAHLHALIEPADDAGLEKLRGIEPDREGLMWREWHLLTHDAEPPPCTLDARDAADADLPWLRARLAEQLSDVELAAFDLEEPRLDLAAVARLYAPLGLERRRTARIVSSVSEPAGLSLSEQSSAGLSLEGFTDAARLFVTTSVEAHRKDAALALAADAARAQQQSARPVLLMIAPELSPALIAAGYRSLGTRIEIIATRDAAAQVVNFVSLLA
jgi:hypothetical protein